MKPRMPTCHEVLDFLADYLDGSLPPEARAAFDRHLAVCPPCVAYLESYKATIALEKDAFRDSGERAVSAVPEALIRAILDARRSPAPSEGD